MLITRANRHRRKASIISINSRPRFKNIRIPNNPIAPPSTTTIAILGINSSSSTVYSSRMQRNSKRKERTCQSEISLLKQSHRQSINRRRTIGSKRKNPWRTSQSPVRQRLTPIPTRIRSHKSDRIQRIIS